MIHQDPSGGFYGPLDDLDAALADAPARERAALDQLAAQVKEAVKVLLEGHLQSAILRRIHGPDLDDDTRATLQRVAATIAGFSAGLPIDVMASAMNTFAASDARLTVAQMSDEEVREFVLHMRDGGCVCGGRHDPDDPDPRCI